MDSVKKNKIKQLLQFTVILLLLFSLYSCYQAKHQHLEIPQPVVVVQHPKILKITQYMVQTGNTVAYNSVDLVARIEGYLEEINFVDGAVVKKGDTLFVIEPAPYLAKLNEAKATLAAQKAIYAYDKSEYERQQRMFRENATSKNNVEKWLAKSQESMAEVDKAQENLEIAKINYSYTHVHAPFDGRIGRHLIDKGNLVGNGAATDLATIDQLDPIYVYFNLNEIDLIPIRKTAQARGISSQTINQVPVSVKLQSGNGFEYEGKLDFVNIGLDASTGTLEFRALLPNKSYHLLPGLFVQIRIPMGEPTPQLTVPDTAIQYDQIGPYILTINSQNIVELKRVTLGGMENGQRAILTGLNKENWVIVNGLQNASQGNKVAPQFEKTS